MKEDAKRSARAGTSSTPSPTRGGGIDHSLLGSPRTTPPASRVPGVCQVLGPTLDARNAVTFLVDSAAGPGRGAERRRSGALTAVALPAIPRVRASVKREPRGPFEDRRRRAGAQRLGLGNSLTSRIRRVRSPALASVSSRRPARVLTNARLPQNTLFAAEFIRRGGERLRLAASGGRAAVVASERRAVGRGREESASYSITCVSFDGKEEMSFQVVTRRYSDAGASTAAFEFEPPADARASRRDLFGARLRVDPRLELRPEVPNQPLHRPRRGVAQRADRVPLDLLRELLKHVDLLQSRVPLLHAFHDVVEPPGALAARRALPARLVLVKVRQPRDRVDDVRGLVHHDHRGGPQPALRGFQRVEIHEHLLANLFRDERHGGPPRDDRE
mmetsp:Transcript_8692/g.31830  ORF Transcript_8692/g.31830 Transcript_8692/m.31830 type:complete len:389 (-) Transcript_8692:993-2159(-)